MKYHNALYSPWLNQYPWQVALQQSLFLFPNQHHKLNSKFVYLQPVLKKGRLHDEQGKVYFYENQNHTEITITTKHGRLNVIINEHKTDSIYKTNFVYPQKN